MSRTSTIVLVILAVVVLASAALVVSAVGGYLWWATAAPQEDVLLPKVPPPQEEARSDERQVTEPSGQNARPRGRIQTGAKSPRVEVGTVRARTAVTRGALSGAHGSLERFRADVGRYPTAREGLAALWVQPTDPVEAGRWRGPYVEGADVFRDGWARPLRYLPPAPGARPRVYSFGPNGRDEGGEGDDIVPASAP
jgi:general secretion pathway protein G